MPSKTFFALAGAALISVFVSAFMTSLVWFHHYEKFQPDLKVEEGEQTAVLKYQIRGTNDAREYCYGDACAVHFQRGNGPECIAAISQSNGREFTAIDCKFRDAP